MPKKSGKLDHFELDITFDRVGGEYPAWVTETFLAGKEMKIEIFGLRYLSFFSRARQSLNVFCVSRPWTLLVRVQTAAVRLEVSGVQKKTDDGKQEIRKDGPPAHWTRILGKLRGRLQKW